MSMKKNDEYVIDITDMSTEGEGVGHVETDGTRLAVFVKDAVVGDRARVKLTKLKKNYAYGRLMEVIIPGEGRVEPACPLASRCGGCSMMQLSYDRQLELKKKDTFEAGIGTLLTLRDELMDEMLTWREKYKREDFDAMPFINADGYHCKNLAYSIWHVFRIEDIVAHDLIAGDDEVLFTGDYQKRIKSPIITTGNELHKEKIAQFTRKLNLDELYAYASEVKEVTLLII